MRWAWGTSVPTQAFLPNERDGPQDSLEEGQEAEADRQEGWLGDHSPLQGQLPFLVKGLELQPLEKEVSAAADPPAIVPGVQVQGGF